MKAGAFDGIARDLGEVSTRRSVLSLLGGAAALGAGLALGGDSLANSKHRGNAKTKAEAHSKGTGNAKHQGQVAAQGKKKSTITICFQTQTRIVKKKGSQTTYPGATLGPCPATPSTPPTPTTPPACTTWIISGGPNQTDQIKVDDDLYILRKISGEYIINDSNRVSSTLSPVVVTATVGEVLTIYAQDAGGCRSLSPLWLHCVATGQKRVLFTGLTSPHCSFPPGVFINQDVTVSL